MKVLFLLITILAASAAPVVAQTKEADPKDVASIDSIIKAVYDVISADAGVPRDWVRFRSLFHPDARLMPTGKDKASGLVRARALTPEQYIETSEGYLMKEGFFEREAGRHTDRYGNIAQVFSTYTSFHKKDEKVPFMRGINSFQLLNDGKRWWILTIYWQAETPENLIPKEFMKTGN